MRTTGGEYEIDAVQYADRATKSPEASYNDQRQTPMQAAYFAWGVRPRRAGYVAL